MAKHPAFLLFLVFAVAACARQPESTAGHSSSTASARKASPPVVNTLAPVGAARMDGYGGLRLGMTAAEMAKAWNGKLVGAPGEGQLCYYLVPEGGGTPPPLAFMMEADKFVRYDVRAGAEVAPGGARIGMDPGDVRNLYGAELQEKPHKFLKDGTYLRVHAKNSDQILLLENDGTRITGWRVGQPPQVDYVEGCS